MEWVSLRLWAWADGHVVLTPRETELRREYTQAGTRRRLRLPKVEIFQRGAKRLNGKLDRANPCNHKSPKVWKDVRTEMYPTTFHWSAVSLEREKRAFMLLTHGPKWQKLTLTERGTKRPDAQLTSGKRNQKVEQRVAVLAPKMGKERKGHQDKSSKLRKWGWMIPTCPEDTLIKSI